MLHILPRADVFMSSPGSVMMLSRPSSKLFYASVSGKNGSIGYFNNRCIVTGISISEATNHQFMNSLNSYVYLYTFGDRISELDVTGVMFLNGECDGKSGFTGAYDFYDENKVSKGVTASVTLTSMGDGPANSITASPCFLTNMTLALNDPSAMLGNFSFKMHYMPNV